MDSASFRSRGCARRTRKLSENTDSDDEGSERVVGEHAETNQAVRVPCIEYGMVVVLGIVRWRRESKKEEEVHLIGQCWGPPT